MKQRMLLIKFLIIAITSSSCNFHNDSDSLENKISSKIDKGIISGVSILIYENDQTIYYSKGWANIKEKKSINENTQFEIGSITKSFVALLIMLSEEEGLLSINDPIMKYFPPGTINPEGRSNQIIIRNLLIHNSGLPMYPDNINHNNEVDGLLNYSRDNMIDFLKNYNLIKEPGTTFNYSNVGYGILGYILEEVHHKSLNRLILEKITTPLGMERTSINLAEHPDKNYADGYFKGEIINRFRNDSCILNGYGALRSSAHDLLIYMKAQAGIIKTPLYDAMLKTQEVQLKNDDKLVCYGWFIDNNLLNFAGSTKGFFSYIILNTRTNKIIVILANTNYPQWLTKIAKKNMDL